MLGRKDGESISLFVEGRDVKINLLGLPGEKARIGIDTPVDTLILSGELLEGPPESFQLHA